MDSFDLVVIGAGPGGYVAAIRAAQLGIKTALVEKDATLGGTCLNVGCIPSKALLESSELYDQARHRFAEHGIGLNGTSLDLERMMARKEGIVGALTAGGAILMKKNKVQVLTGTGLLKGPGRVDVHQDDLVTELECRNVILAMGSMPVELPFMPFDGEHIISSTEALSFTAVPKHLVVVGAGAVGLELASVWRRLGAEVTVVEMLPRIVPFADAQMSKQLQRFLSAQGLEIRLSSKVTAAEVAGDAVQLSVEDAKGEVGQLFCDKVLVAVGRRPSTGTAGLEEAGVALDEAGRVQVDDSFATSVGGVFAIGDLIRGPMLAHKAEEEGMAVAENLAGASGHVNYRTIPNVVYTDPELASVGKTEDELKGEGVPYSTGRFYFRANGRAKSMGAEDGLVKILAHKETDTVLGVHMVGPRVSELIAEAVAVMEFGGSAEDLARTCHAHPTLSEVVKEAALAVDGRAIHG